MKSYQNQPFQSSNAGLTKMVKALQGLPAMAGASYKSTGVVSWSYLLNRALVLQARIQKLSPASSAGKAQAQAVVIGWDVYAWLQAQAGASTVIAPRQASWRS